MTHYYRHITKQDILDVIIDFDDATNSDEALWKTLRTQQKRIDKLELVNEALLQLLLTHKVLDAKEIEQMIVRIDLADGVEDGKISKETAKDFPTCVSCQRPINPERSDCVYCGASVSKTLNAMKKPNPTVGCQGCGDTIPERESFFSGNGLLCQNCYHKIEQLEALVEEDF